jgi:cephalosporin-C deacetylase-like acetyl esterase
MRVAEELLRAQPRAQMLPQFILSRAAHLAGPPLQAGAEVSELDAHAVRQRIVDALGIDRIPRSRDVTLVDRIEHSDCSIEKLAYEATPGLVVPALLYLPRTRGPHPAVVHAPGHWMENAKLDPDIQRLNHRLVRNGVAVFCYDTLGQGERRIGWHQHGQLAPLLVGFTSLGVMVRDSIGALDILQERVDIDPDRLAMVGASGGGFSTIFAAAIDERIRTAAIGCIVNTHLSQIRDAAFGTGWDSWVDLCNQVPELCTVGSMGEILACTAPRSLLIAHADDDPSFPLAGAREVASEVDLRYQARGAKDRFRYVEVPGGHGLHPAMRTTLSTFLLAHLDVPDELPGPEALALTPQWAVPHDVATAQQPQSNQGRPSNGTCLREPADSNGPLVDIARRRAIELRRLRPPLTTVSLQRLLGPFPEKTPLRARVTNHIALPEGFAQRLTITPEPGIELDSLLFLPDSWSDDLPPVVVMLDEGGKEQALRSRELAHIRRRGCAMLIPDLRGTGESAASEFEVSTAAWMLDRDLLNQRVGDVVRLVDYLSGRYSTGQQVDKGRIIIWGDQAFGLVALIAGALDARVAAVGATGISSLEDLLVRDSRVTPMAYRYRMLETLDLVDLAQLMNPRPALVGVTPTDSFAALDTLLQLRSSGESAQPRSSTG